MGDSTAKYFNHAKRGEGSLTTDFVDDTDSDLSIRAIQAIRGSNSSSPRLGVSAVMGEKRHRTGALQDLSEWG